MMTGPWRSWQRSTSSTSFADGLHPGRYVVLDIFPVGADPTEAMKRADDGPPTPEQLEGTIPHSQPGMIAEFPVEP